MTPFQKFAQLVHQRFVLLSQNELYVTVEDGRAVSDAYLAAFPEGSNPVYITNTEHDCSCCKNFIRNLGNVVGFVDGELTSVWAVEGAGYPYDQVAHALHTLVTGAPITGLFRTSERKYGAEHTLQQVDGSVMRWNHFHGQVAGRHFTAMPDKARGDYNTTAQVFKRGLEELKGTAFTEVLDLISSNSLYRGEEHREAIKAFLDLKIGHGLCRTELARSKFIWTHAHLPAARFRNTVIGTLIQDLSEGVELEGAVKSFEAKVAPTNYKRPTALISPRMVNDALATIADLGLDSALERRFAKLSDVTINNVLWADSSAAAQMKGHLASVLMGAATEGRAARASAKAEEIAIADFMANILPKATGIDMLVQNSHAGKFMSLTAPVNLDAKSLFKWGNDFAWSYNGNITDSIKERVKAAGGSVTGDLCCRLAWEYADDLDFHMHEPDGNHIYYAARRQTTNCGGMLDLDANGADGPRKDPAENIVYADKARMKEGTYRLVVNNFSRRSTGKGFVVEIDIGGMVHSINYEQALRTGENAEVATIEYTKARGLRILSSLPSTQTSKDMWGVKTETFVKVNTLMHSPNHWDDNQVGNKHWFFMLEGCKNAEPTRGIYNEFLCSGLEQHRKVFEVLGDKTKCPVTDDQLSGLGFSSTRGDTVTVQVKDAKTRKTYNINF